MSVIRSLFGSNSYVADERPKNYREGIAKLYPNGTAALTAILAKMKGERVDDPEFNWWTKALPEQGGAITGVYTNTGLSTAYTSGATAGTILYFKCAAATSQHFRVGHQAIMRLSTNVALDTVGKVTAVVDNGASSYVAVKLLEADDNGGATYLASANYIGVVGNINAEGAAMPASIAYDPVKFYNLTQIFRTPLSITRTAKRTRVRTKEKYIEMKNEALEMHSIEMEKAFLYGIRTENTGDNGMPERTTMGIIPFLKQNGGLVDSYKSTSLVASSTSWLNGGEDWIDGCLEILFRQGGSERLALCGSGALLAINKLAKSKGDWTFTDKTGVYGIQVAEWRTPFGTLYMKTHPLFSQAATERNNMVILDPGDLRYRYVDDTTFYADGEKQNTGAGRVDSTNEEWLTEAGLELHFPQNFAYLTDFGAAHN